MRSHVLICLVLMGVSLATPHPQSPYYRDQTYQDENRYPGPAPQADQYVPEPPKYQKKYVEEEEDEDYDNVNTIPGEAGTDYPVLFYIPNTGFSCSEKLPGFYADEAARCQVWHYCKTDGLMESFLCPNGTIYNQANRVCEWWFNVKCDAETISLQARVNEDLYIIPSPKPEDEYSQEAPKYSREPPQYARESPQYARETPQYARDPPQYARESPAPAPRPQQYSQETPQYQQPTPAFQYSPEQSVFRES